MDDLQRLNLISPDDLPEHWDYAHGYATRVKLAMLTNTATVLRLGSAAAQAAFLPDLIAACGEDVREAQWFVSETISRYNGRLADTFVWPAA